MGCLVALLLVLKLALGAMAWDVVLANQTDLYQYFNLVRCLAANEPTSNTTIGLDHDNILGFDITAQNPDHASFVFGYCWNNYANKTMTIHSINNPDEDIIQPVHIKETLDGHEMFKNCSRPRFNGARKFKRSKYSNYYVMHMSDTPDDCSSTEQFDTYTDICQDDQKNPFYAFLPDNSDNDTGLVIYVWPHHDCDKGNSRMVSLAAGATGECVSRKVYSWFGSLSKDECYQSTNVSCTQVEVDEWTGTIAIGAVNYGGGKLYDSYS
ncbi:putative secreted protein [Wickerhamomyces ciferrii]|uniref:Secreted protein n=1 Tax=Wickerhamomyces ciferrii (strain ATCC 14091 / BCRC 22168 / CBS 111 / JCM 3599 / NBRC 0793 / NRRL Y-1031 F-60-10) TaxID=1206466 RepID=K0KYA9_WICCF|nr:uncharacterized protein BN7_6028 [Wickerhamomyces ciferrii]CCH46434.1 putative secreted protein [Wickerhamomyces ciferrii]